MYEKNKDILENGRRIVTLDSWDEFKHRVRNLQSKRGCVWRGQKKDEIGGWPLKSSFDREIQTANKQDRSKKLKKHFAIFKEEMNKFHPNALPSKDIDIWALGQHYGLKTPLLDWTLSPYIAAYFAFIEEENQKKDDDKHRYVYALNRSIERLLSKQKKGENVISKDRSALFIDKMPNPNPRFTAQKGIFTQALKGIDIWEYVEILSNKRPNEEIIVKFRILTKDREKCLYDLHLMKIDHVSLLLDFHDIAFECNQKFSANKE